MGSTRIISCPETTSVTGIQVSCHAVSIPYNVCSFAKIQRDKSAGRVRTFHLVAILLEVKQQTCLFYNMDTMNALTATVICTARESDDDKTPFHD